MLTEVKPYIVSADVYGLCKRWSEETGYSIPTKSFFLDLLDSLSDKLKTIFPSVDIVPEEELRENLNKCISDKSLAKYPVVSLDRAYIAPDHPRIEGWIDMTRTVDEKFNGIGLRPRQGFLPLKDQLAVLRTTEESPVSLVDDVIFSGKGLIDISRMLAAVNRPVGQAIAAIGVSQGIEELDREGIEVICVREYGEVLDEVCERDFFACVPFSGRTLIDRFGVDWSAPYFTPYGNPGDWASIPPEHVHDFSDFCLRQSASLWRKIEIISNENIPTYIKSNKYGVPRRIRGMKKSTSVVRALAEDLFNSYRKHQGNLAKEMILST